MKVAIDLTPLHGRRWTGVELYAIDLYKALITLGYDVIPIFHVKNDVDNNSNAYIIDKSTRIVLENYALSKSVRKINADINLFPIFPPPIDLYFNRPGKIVPVIHDTAFLRHRATLKFAAKYYLTPKYKAALKKSDFIVSISETAKSQLEQYTPKKVINWGENIAEDYKPENIKIDYKLLDKFRITPNEYYISVSTIEPRKNLKYLLRTIEPELRSSCKKLVLVGRRGWGEDDELRLLIEKMSDSIIFTEYVSTDTLQSLYHYAYAFALLSLDEGFGRTPLEAIACGCKKIIVSDIDIFHETMGDSGNYIPLSNERLASELFSKHQWKDVKAGFELPFNVMEKKINLVENIDNYR